MLILLLLTYWLKESQRIFELAEQVGIMFSDERVPETGFEYRGATVTPGDLKKFAELIVREGADFLDAFNKEHMVEEGIGGAELKKHFGVEE